MEYIPNNCNHNDVTPYNSKFFCRQCGSYMAEDGSIPIKNKKYSYPGYLNPIQNIKKQWNKSIPTAQQPPDYQKQRNTLIDYMIEWSEKLRLSPNSLFLGVQFLDYFISTKRTDPTQFRLYGATCLMLASKAIELDERIPFISKLRRYTYLPYATSDFRRCECQIIKQLNWNLQYTTVFDWAESALSLGLIFEQDEIVQEENVLKEKNQNILPQKQELFKEHLDNVFKQPFSKPNAEKLQDQLIKLCYSILKDGTYLDKDPAELTVSMIACARKACGLKTQLPKCLSNLFEQVPASFAESFDEQFIKGPIRIPFGRELDYFSLQNYRNRVM